MMSVRLNQAVGLVLLFLACGRGERVGVSNETPVILISIDTLRSDHLPAYGYGGVATPGIDALRKDSILYQNAYSHCPLTLPSHATMFTGRLPADTGIRDNLGFRLNEGSETIAEVLRKRGYRTGAAVSSFVLRRETGIARGFEFYEDGIEARATRPATGVVQRDGRLTVDHAMRWIGGQGENPFFFFLHLYEPHTPYDPPEPFKSRYPLAYDGEIANVDDIVGGFLRFLKERGLYDKSLIIFTSDHGEGLGDHGEEEHGIFLYREDIQIPLLVKLPAQARAGESVATPVQLIDLVPTIAQLTRSKVTRADPSASSLVDIRADAKRTIFSESYYPRLHFGWSELHSLVDEKHHLIDAPRPELYDLTADRKEQNNILADRRRVYSGMKQVLQPLVRAANAPLHVDPEETARLAALGYIGSAVTASGETLPDPKDKVASLKEIKAAFALFHAKKYEEALRLFGSLLEENPRMLDMWDMSARTLMKLGREQEAIAAAKEALRLAPRTTRLQIMIADLALDLGLFDEAAQHAELALAAAPGQAREVLARIWLARGDVVSAEREARLAVDQAGESVIPLLTLSRIESQKKDHAAALRYAEQAQAVLRQKKRPVTMNVSYLRGEALAGLGRFAEAERAFVEETRSFPDEPLPYTKLIFLFVSQGRMEEATTVVFDLTRNSPTAPAYLAVIQTLRTVGDEKGARHWTRKAVELFPRDPRVLQLIRAGTFPADELQSVSATRSGS